jgi:hypothetical protein
VRPKGRQGLPPREVSPRFAAGTFHQTGSQRPSLRLRQLSKPQGEGAQAGTVTAFIL